MSLADLIPALDQRLAARLDATIRTFEDAVRTHLREQHERTTETLAALRPAVVPGLDAEDLAPLHELLGAQGREQAFATLLAAVRAIDGAGEQVELLCRLLEQSAPFAARAALLVVSEHGATGWAGRGFGDGVRALDGVELGWTDPAWAPFARGAGVVSLADDGSSFCGQLGSPKAGRAVLVPLVLQDRVAAALYADDGGGQALETAPLQLLVQLAAARLESLDSRGASPTLHDAAASSSSLALGLVATAAAVAAGSSLRVESPAIDAREDEVTAVHALVSEETTAEMAEDLAQDVAEPVVVPEVEAASETASSETASSEDLWTPEEAVPPVEPPVDDVWPASAATEVAVEAVEAVEEPVLATPEVEAGEAPAFEAPAFETPAFETPAFEAPAFESAAEGSSSSGMVAADEDLFEATSEAFEVEAVAELDVEAELPATDIFEPVAETSASIGDEAVEATAEAVADEDEVLALPDLPDLTEPAPLEPAAGGDDGSHESFQSVDATVAVSQSLLREYARSQQAVAPSTVTSAVELPAPEEVAAPLEAATPPVATGWSAPTPAVDTEDETLLLRRPAPVAADPEDDTNPTIAKPGGPEIRSQGGMVVAPSDLSGPGWAFRAGRTPEASADPVLEEARRLARLLVSEIKLYNEEQVEEGRRKRDLYARLRDDIDRSREVYESRVNPKALEQDFFREALIRVLAGGDPNVLGA